MKILIASAFYPPLNSIASLRPYSWKKYWTLFGENVKVLTTQKLGVTESSEENVISIPIPLFSIYRKLLGLVFNCFHPRNIASMPGSDNLDTTSYSEQNLWLKKIKSSGAFKACRMPDFHDLWAISSITKLKRTSWDCVVSTGGPYSVHFIGYYLKTRGLTNYWICDWRDLWTENPHFHGLPVVRLIEKQLEGLFHATADAVTTVSDGLSNTIQTNYHCRTETIYNGFEPLDFSNSNVKNVFPKDGKFRIVYTGSIYPSQNFSIFFRAISIMSKQKLIHPGSFEISFAGNDASEHAKKFGVENYYKYYGHLSYQTSLQMQKTADILLHVDYSTKNPGILSGKIFEYMASGTPIFVVGGNTNSTLSSFVIENSRGFVVFENLELIVETLRQLINSPVGVAKRPLSSNLLNFTRENQARKMLQLIRNLTYKQNR